MVDKKIKAELRLISSSDNWHWALYAAKDYVVVGLSVAICFKVSMWFYPLAWLLIGTRQRGLANLMHAGSHNTLASSKVLNFIASTWFSGYWVGQQYVTYCYSHVTNHHGHLGDQNLDPDFKQHLDLGLYKSMHTKRFIAEFIVKPFLGCNIPRYIGYVFRDRIWYSVPRRYDNKVFAQSVGRSMFFVFWAVVFIVSVTLGVFHWLLLFWLAPLFTSAMMLGWFIEMAEHYPLVNNSVSNRMYHTRNRHGNWFEMIFSGVHYDNYHLEHHLNPNVPMWNLPKSNKIRLRDDEYRKWDESWGGIFTSKDKKPTRRIFMQYVIDESRKSSAAKINTKEGW